MKKIVAILMCIVLVTGCTAMYASAGEMPQSETDIEYFADGSYVVTELEQSSNLVRATKTGYKTRTYYTASDIKVFMVSLTGNFSYTSGVSSKATSASVTVTTYASGSKFVSKNAYCSGKTAYGSGTVSYGGFNLTQSPSLSCDTYGNLS